MTNPFYPIDLLVTTGLLLGSASEWRLRTRNRPLSRPASLTGLRLGSGTIVVPCWPVLVAPLPLVLLAALFHSAGLRLASGTILVLLALVSTCRSIGASAALFYSAGLRLGSGTVLVFFARAGAAAGRATTRAGTAATRAASAATRAGTARAASPSAGACTCTTAAATTTATATGTSTAA
jgi:hypothetical protein